MKNTVEKYLERRSVHKTWALQGDCTPREVHTVVVIPALAEHAHVFETIEALHASGVDAQKHTLVLCVVNNHAQGVAHGPDLANNQATLRELSGRACARRHAPLMLGWVDASSPGCTLPPGQGVGLARKIGLDHGLHLLYRQGRLDRPLVCLDADSPPAPGYLDALDAHYAHAVRWAGYTAYLHRFSPVERERRAMVAYEIYMRFHELGLRWAGSPYAYPALGSIISCTARAYAAVGGMNKRLAGEDFYFMQQLAKTGDMDPVPCALVYPSGRSSARTPFGTGRTVSDYGSAGVLLYDPACYENLRNFFLAVENGCDLPAPALMEQIRAACPDLAAFLTGRQFENAWEKLQAQHPDRKHLCRQFHCWFDGLKTIQGIHYLRTRGMHDLPRDQAVKRLLALCGQTGLPPGAASEDEEMLALLRQLGLRSHAPEAPLAPDYCPAAFFRPPAMI